MTVESATVVPIAEGDPAILQRVAFPAGLLGFPECRDFLLTATGRSGFYWLRSCEHEALAFLLADPFLFFPEYTVDLGEGDLASPWPFPRSVSWTRWSMELRPATRRRSRPPWPRSRALAFSRAPCLRGARRV